MTAMTATLLPEIQASPAAISPEQLTRETSLRLLLIWRIVQDGGITEQLCAISGHSCEELEQMLSEHAADYREYLRLAQTGALLDITDLFELARVKLGQMLAACSRPTELRTLLGCIRLLPGAKAIAAAIEQAQQETDALMRSSSGMPETTAARTDAASETGRISSRLQKALDNPELNRQQRRSLERQLRKQQR